VLAVLTTITAFLIIAVALETLISIVLIVVGAICILSSTMTLRLPVPRKTPSKRARRARPRIAPKEKYEGGREAERVARYYSIDREICKLKSVRGASMEETIAEYFRVLLGASEVNLSQVLEGKRTKHEIDIVFKKGDDMYLAEIKNRSLVPSDIENLSGIYQDITTEINNVKELFVITTGDVTKAVRNMAVKGGIHIVKPEDLRVLLSALRDN
jgi:hypothetical protein